MQRVLDREVPGDAGVYVLSGKLLVVSNNRVGRIDDDKTDARPLDAVIARVKATMKDEKPRLLCLAPKVTRKIPISTRP